MLPISKILLPIAIVPGCIRSSWWCPDAISRDLWWRSGTISTSTRT